MPEPAIDRQIRVFISSTFRDMMRERDLLVKEVFPELRRKYPKRFVTFTEVDLRWGISEKARSDAAESIRPVRVERARQRARHDASAVNRRPTFC